MAKQQKQNKPKFIPKQWDIQQFPQQLVMNPVIERAVRTIALHFSKFKDQDVFGTGDNARMPYVRPFAAAAPNAVVTVGFFHNGFQEIEMDAALVSKLVTQGFRLKFIYAVLERVVTEDSIPMLWVDGDNTELLSPLRTTMGALEYAVSVVYYEQCAGDGVAWEQDQLTKDKQHA